MDIVDHILKNKFKTIAIDGKAGSGKTTFARSLASRLNACLLPVDLFHRQEREKWSVNTKITEFEDFEKVKKVIAKIKKGEKFTLENVYNHADGKFTRSFKIEPKDIIVIEGLMSMLLVVDYKIFLDIDAMVALLRSKERDMRERNLTEQQWLVKKHLFHDEYSKLVPHLKKRANLIIDTTEHYPELSSDF